MQWRLKIVVALMLELMRTAAPECKCVLSYAARVWYNTCNNRSIHEALRFVALILK
jgi:hypothetical protein